MTSLACSSETTCDDESRAEPLNAYARVSEKEAKKREESNGDGRRD